MLHCRDAKAPCGSARSSPTRAGSPFTGAELPAQLHPGKSIFISRGRVSAYSTGVEEGPGEGRGTYTKLHKCWRCLPLPHTPSNSAHIPEPLCEEKGDFSTEPGCYFHTRSLEASRSGGNGGEMLRLPGAGEGHG